MGEMGSITALLERTKLSDLCKSNQKVVLLEHNLTIGDALKKLAKHKILSAPMVMEPGIEEISNGDQSPQLLGWIDISDILRAFLDHLQQAGTLPTNMLSLMTALEKEGPLFADKLLVTVRGVEDRGLVYQAEGSSTSLLTALRELFLRPSPGGEASVVHRIAVFEAHGEITNVISQMDIIRFLLSHVDLLGPAANQTLEALGLLAGKPPVQAVSPHVPTLLAYARMAAQHVSASPVVTDEGELIANLSVSDLRALTSDHFGVLALPVAEFLAVEHHTAYIGYSVHGSDHARHPFFASTNRPGGPRQGDVRVLSVHPDTLLRELLHKLVEEHIHRVYVSERGGPPRATAVITLTDVLRHVAGVF